MARRQLSPDALSNILKVLGRSAVQEAVKRARTPAILTGTVEDLNPELDIAYVRMDLEAMGTDPYRTLNYGAPGIIPATRLGQTYIGEQVRVEFDGSAGASAMQTSVEKRIVLPYGAEAGKLIELSGEEGNIALRDDDGRLVGLLSPELWAIGDLETPGRRITIDPVGGIRLRDENDTMVSLIDQLGYTLRSGRTGQVTAEIRHGSFRLVDPNGTDDIEMVTSATGTLPNPSYESVTEANPGGTLDVPAAPVFTSTPADDISIGHVVAWRRAGSFPTAVMTEPAGWTERLDRAFADDAGTLHLSVATKHPADGAAGTFTSSLTGWQHAIGTHVVLRGGGGTSPTYLGMTTSEQVVTADTAVASVEKPPGVTEGDTLIVFVSLGANGGFVPTGWTTPEGFVFLGAVFTTSGQGPTQSTLSTGAWVKLAGANEPSSYSTIINMPTGTKLIQGTMVAVRNAFLVPGGAQIRIAGRPMRRLLKYVELQEPSSVLCDFTDIPTAYDNLELLVDATCDGNGGGGAIRSRLRVNGDAGSNYTYQLFAFSGGDQQAAVSQQQVATSRILLGPISNLTGSALVNSLHIYGYATARPRKPVSGQGYGVVPGPLVRNEQYMGQWDGADPIERITVEADGGPNRFAAGSRAYLWGY